MTGHLGLSQPLKGYVSWALGVIFQPNNINTILCWLVNSY